MYFIRPLGTPIALVVLFGLLGAGCAASTGADTEEATVSEGAELVTTDSVTWTTNSVEPSKLRGGLSLHSADRSHTAQFQTDGNFVVYHGASPLWATHTNGGAYLGYRMGFTSTGDFYIDRSDGKRAWTAVQKWSVSCSPEYPESYQLVMQNDGNLVLYHQCSGSSTKHPYWATSTNGR
jgi:hypothetical protein